MPLISSTVPNLINGVSQQPAALRLASQSEVVNNAMPSPVEGLKKRPPFKNLGKVISGSGGANRPFTQIVDRDGVVRYLIMIQDNALKVFGIDGSIKTVTATTDFSYLNITGKPSEVFRVASVADYTFITNREKTVAMAATTSPVWGTESMVFIKASDFSATFTVTVAGTAVTHATAASPTASTNVGVATALAAAINANATLNTLFTATSDSYILRIVKNNGGAYTLTTKDDRSGNLSVAIKETVSALTDLPTIAPHGFIVEILGNKTSDLDNYYVKFETTTGSGFGPGVWRETVAPGIVFEFDETTMPHVLIYNATTDDFTFEKFNYSGRIAGDVTTAPNPTFVGTKITNLQLFRNRLVFLSDENVILSAADSFDRFWPETVQTVVDSDPIDIATGGQEINFLTSSLAFANSLLLFSRHGQFRLDTGNIAAPLTPKTASVAALTTFEMVDTVDPIALGRTIFFAIPKGVNSGIREFFLPDSSGPAPVSEEVTASVPRYVEDNLCSMCATVSEEMLVMLSSDAPSTLYIYKFLFQNDTKIQSAWVSWQVSSAKSIISADILDSDLYILVQYTDGVYLERNSLRPETVDPNTSIEILLDRRTEDGSCTSVLTTPAGLDVQTTITLPYPILSGSTMAVVGRFASPNTIQHGQVIFPISQTLAGGAGGNGTLTVRGNLTAAKFFVGELYSMLYEFSTQYIKEAPPGGGIAIAAGPKLMLKTWTMIFDATSAFEVKITNKGRTTLTYPYNAIVPGDNSLLGALNALNSRFRVPVMAENLNAKIQLASSSPLPCRFQSAEWEGFYHTRATRL